MSARLRLLSVFLSAGSWLLSACAPMTIRDTESQTFVPFEGWVLELHQDVTIPAQRTRVFFQSGRVVPAINEYEPHCQLRVRTLSEQSQLVRADSFSVDDVFGFVDQIVSSGGIQLAAQGELIYAGGGSGNGNGESRMAYFYFMALHSDSQPDVSYWVCAGALLEPAWAKYPTLQDIRAAMGGYATLIIPGD